MAESERRQFVKFNFFKVAPEWRFLSEQERTDGKRELSAVVDECSTHMFIRSFSMVGIRGDADFLLWQACDTLEELQDMMTSVYKTQMGRYLQQPYSYLAMTRRSQYVGEHRHEGQEGTSVRIRPGEAKYFVVYPFLKTREWYVLPSEERQRMMMTH
ncbi:MAG TPA: chlorite dismutase, partial [Dehalococcoidia bacterium]|nr:chlorite dismutase [Dehalococcoidia bacterium]